MLHRKDYLGQLTDFLPTSVQKPITDSTWANLDPLYPHSFIHVHLVILSFSQSVKSICLFICITYIQAFMIEIKGVLKMC